jgi:hypothetical protein
MKNLTSEQRPIFCIFLLFIFLAWFQLLSLYYRVVLHRLTLAQAGYDKIVFLGATLTLSIIMLVKLSFLRPEFNWKKIDKFIAFCRLLQFGCLSAIILLGSPILINLFTGHFDLIPFARDTIEMGCFAGIISMLEEFIIEPRKISLDDKKFRRFLKQIKDSRT